jgi:hypothetical protein
MCEPGVAEPGAVEQGPAPTWQSRAFGLHVRAPFPVPGAPSCDGEGMNPGTLITLTSAAELDRAWRAGDRDVLVDMRHPSGRPALTVEHRSDLGFRIWMPRYGRHVISCDGSRIRSALPKISREHWQRLLFAQPLPLAALLRGRALFHASAVALGEQVLVFTAPSGTGKTSLAGHLVSRGATLIADDVLALTCADDRVLAHAATGLISIDAEELASIAPELRRRVGVRLGHVDKAILCCPVAERPLPVRRVYCLERGPQVRRLDVRRIWPPDLRLLLSARFFGYVRRPEVWKQHLDVCAALAVSAELCKVAVPPGLTAARVAAKVEEHFERTA